MKLPNGYGGIRKLKGNRRRPYQATVTAGWELINGRAKQIQKTVGYYATKAEALNALAEYNGNPIDIDKLKLTFADVWERYLPTQNGKSLSKQRSLANAFKKAARLHNKPLSQITYAQLQGIIDTANSYSYKRELMTAYRGLYDYAMRYGYIKNNIASMLQNTAPAPKPSVNVFTKAEMDAMPYYFKLFFYTGVRVGEMEIIEYDDIDFERGLLLVRGSKTKNALRFIPIHNEIKDIVMGTKRGEKLWKYHGCYTKLYNEFISYAPKHKPHDMRKTFATACYLSGVDDVITKRLMGHQIKDITHSTYIKNDDVNLLRTAIEKVNMNLLPT